MMLQTDQPVSKSFAWPSPLAEVERRLSVVAYKQAERKEQDHQWYLLGPKLRELELRSILQDERGN